MSKQVGPYVPSPQPELPGSDRQYLRDELRKIEAAIRLLMSEIDKLRAVVHG